MVKAMSMNTNGCAALRDLEGLGYHERPAPEAKKPQPSRKALRRRRARMMETLLFGVAFFAVFAFIVVSGVQGFYRAASAGAAYTPPPAMIAVTVGHGDTLWKYADRYGAPDQYILDRVESIARLNGLPREAALLPGERLRIPVTNPVELAKLQHSPKARLASRTIARS